MNTREMAEIGWDEQELTACLAAFVRQFHRLPSQDDLERFHSAEAGQFPAGA